MVSTAVLLAASISSAAERDLFVDLTNALQRAADMSNRTAVPAAPPKPLPRDVSLLGVVIAGETRLALLGSAAGSELLAVGASLGGYRLVEVEENQATLEGERGERIILSLQNGDAGAATGLTRPAAAPNR